MMEGLVRTTDFIQLYNLREELCLQSDRHDFESKFVELYSQIFEYQALVICHVSHRAIRRGARNIVNPGQWKEALATVVQLDQQCQEFMKIVNLKVERESWNKLTCQLDDLFSACEGSRMEQKSAHEERELRELLETFSTDYEGDKNINPKRVPGTCEWFLEDPRFLDWRDATNSQLLWGSADPGCGKSVLSRCLVDEGLTSTNSIASTTCYFFFKDGQENREKGTHAFSAILHQLLVQNDGTSLDAHALSGWKKHGKQLRDRYEELWKIVREMAAAPEAGEIVCVLDALDECREQDRNRIIDSLVEFYSDNASKPDSDARLKFLVTSRPYGEIETGFWKLKNVVNYIRFDGGDESDKISKEINLVINHRVPEIASKFSLEEQAKIVQNLKSREHRTYLWLHLILDVIERKALIHGSEKSLRKCIDQLPGTINDAYEEILAKSEDPERAEIILQIILAAKRPLTVSEMNIALALAMQNDARAYEDLDCPSDEAFKGNLKQICRLFVTVHNGKVYLLHQTAREFLIRQVGSRSENSAVWQQSIDLRDANFVLAKASISLLLFRKFENPACVQAFTMTDITGSVLLENAASWQWFDENIFLSYSAEHWMHHHNSGPEIEKGSAGAMTKYILDLCDSSSPYFRHWFAWYCLKIGFPPSFEGNQLINACIVGLHDFAELLLDAGANVNAREPVLGTIPLEAAARFGDTALVQLLLDHNANVNAESGEFGDALTAASWRGHEAVVRLLLNHGAEVCMRDRSPYPTAYEVAADLGYDDIMDLLRPSHERLLGIT